MQIGLGMGMVGNLAQSGGATLQYLVRDTFTTGASAPLTTPRACEPTGTVNIVDVGNLISISSGSLLVNGATSTGDGIVTASQTRRSGKAFLVDVTNRTTVDNNVRFGWSTANLSDGLLDIGFDYSTSSDIRIKIGTAAIDTYALGGSDHSLAFVMRGTGGFAFARNGTVGVYRLLWVYPTVSSAMFAKMWLGTGSHNYRVDNFRVAQLTGAFSTDNGLATSFSATTTANQTATMQADALVEHTITGATGVTQELMVRRTDDDNCWIVRMAQGAGTIALFEKNAGVETSRASTTQTWANGTQYRVTAICDGGSIRVYVDNTQRLSYASASFNASATGVKVSHAAANLAAWPRTATIVA